MHFEDFSHPKAGTDLSSMNLDQDRNDLKIIENVLVHGREVGEGSVCVVPHALEPTIRDVSGASFWFARSRRQL